MWDQTIKWPILILVLCVSYVKSSFFGLFPDFDEPKINPNFQFYWNVPTFMCHKHSIFFDEVSSELGIEQNVNDEFRGNKIAILYDPGSFPAILEDSNGVYLRNGGVPQEGDLQLHLDHFKDHLLKAVKNESFDGLGVIDFESWRPIFRQNWASLEPYRTLSYKLERQIHPLWSDTAIRGEATRRFELRGKSFVEETVKLAKKLRPKASWGYYAYPYCYNWTPKHQKTSCNPTVLDENNKLSWLFKNEQLFLPSVYLRQTLTRSQRAGMVRGRIAEAVRLRNKFHPSETDAPRVFAYFWYKYQDEKDTFLDKQDTYSAFLETLKQGGDGIIIWGSSDDVKTREKCLDLKKYVKTVLSPAMYHLRKNYILNRSPDDIENSNDDDINVTQDAISNDQ